MTKAQRLAVSSAGLAGMFLIGSLTFHSGSQAKGAYSSPVTVMNTNSNPVPGLDSEKMARIPYESTVNPSCTAGPGACFFFSGPPAGFRLVAENLAGYFQISPGLTLPVGYVEDNTFRISTAFTAPLGPLDAGGHTQAAFNQPTKFYIDQSQGAAFAVVSTTWSNGSSTMTLTGYLENCSITGCPAVQH
jgi:hypothetical protein